MRESFSPELVATMPGVERRRSAADAAQEMDLPSVESEEWRYSPVGDLDLERFEPQVKPATGVAPDPFERMERAATVSVINGWVSQVDLDSGWAAKGLEVGPATLTDQRRYRTHRDRTAVLLRW